MIRRLKTSSPALLLSILFTSFATTTSADIVINAPTGGTAYNGAVTDSILFGGTDQVGLTVTAEFSTFTETVNLTGSGNVGTATGTGWFLQVDAEGGSGKIGTFGDSDENLSDDGVLDTVNEVWFFERGSLPDSVALNKITIDGVISGIVFDRPVLNGTVVATPYRPTATGITGGNRRDHEGADDLGITGNADETGTAGSDRGRDFYTSEFDEGSEPNVEVTYSNMVGTVGDLFATVEIAFVGGLTGSQVSAFNFAIDTDKTSGLTAVPEASAFACVGLAGGIAALVVRRRRGARSS